MVLLLPALLIASTWNILAFRFLNKGPREIVALAGSVSICSITAQIGINIFELADLSDRFFEYMFWALLSTLTFTTVLLSIAHVQEWQRLKGFASSVLLGWQAVGFIVLAIVITALIIFDFRENIFGDKIVVAVLGAIFLIAWWSFIRLCYASVEA